MSHQPDFVEANRAAHELEQRHGRGAHQYAAKLAKAALARGDAEEHRFWSDVEAMLRPRDGAR